MIVAGAAQCPTSNEHYPTGDPEMSDEDKTVEDEDYDFVTTAREFGTPPELPWENVKLPEIKKKVRISALSAADFSDLQDANRVYNRAGEHVGWDYSNEDIKLLAFALRDGSGNRLFQTVESAVATLEHWPLSSIKRMVTAANKVTNSDPVSAEKNSEETPSDDSPSVSA
jgi:hypothetical protein